MKLSGVASRAHDRMDTLNRCHGLLEQAVRESRLTGHLAVLRGGESMYIDRVQSDSTVQVINLCRTTLAAHTSAAGNVLQRNLLSDSTGSLSCNHG